ncbi:15 kDa protein A [Tupaia chinensis]|uniref:15 kDa protein A n=1 Tax=Tupaia chinensis TaxID=246437 RepID=L8Y0F0_TUPCH|nr:15 kDa protein A [Tupaia chinensis]
MMAGAWRALVLVLGVAVVACVAHHRLTYEQIIAQALKSYNEGRQGEPLFRLLEATPPPRLEERKCTGSFTRVLHIRALTLTCDRDCRRAAGLEGGAMAGQERGQPVIAMADSLQLPSGVRSSPEAKSTTLPPAVRNLYEKAKYEIIANILRNF